MIWIILGALVILAVFGIPLSIMVSDLGWGVVLQVWAISIAATAAIMGGAAMIAYGIAGHW